jgi:hypothetical protein
MKVAVTFRFSSFLTDCDWSDIYCLNEGKDRMAGVTTHGSIQLLCRLPVEVTPSGIDHLTGQYLPELVKSPKSTFWDLVGLGGTWWDLVGLGGT